MSFKKAIKLLAKWLDEKEELEMLLTKSKKKSFCMPTHLPEDEALHVIEQANERGWSNSQYIRSLVTEDHKRCLDENHLMSISGGLDSKQIELLEQSVRNEQK